jgi:C4-type Zn-finger protein
MERKKTYEGSVDSKTSTCYCSKIEGIVVDFEEENKGQSIFSIKSEEETVRIVVPFKAHKKILEGTKIFYALFEDEFTNSRVIGYEFPVDGPDPIFEDYEGKEEIHCIRILEGYFEGIVYSRRTYEEKKS